MALNIRKRLQKRFANYVLGNLYNIVTSEDVLQTNEKGETSFEGRILTESERSRLQAEAVSFETTLLYKVIKSELVRDASKRMYFEAHNDDDLLAGKMELWIVQVIKQTVDKCKQFF